MSVSFVGAGDMFAHPDIRRRDHIPVVAVNTIGVMGAGQALAYRQWDEQGYQAYRDLCSISPLGSPIAMSRVCPIGGAHGAALMFPTMPQPGMPSSLDWIDEGTRDWVRQLTDFGTTPPHIWHVPQLGCGIGRLSWSDVAAILVDRLSGIDGQTFLLYGPEVTS